MESNSQIPIENIYYLLIYAWDCLEESEIVGVQAIESTNLLDLLGRVLANGISHLLKRGLDRGYVPLEEDTGSPRGRFNAPQTISRLLHKKAQLNCNYDDLSYDVLHNQIVKATVCLLLRTDRLSKGPHCLLTDHLRRLSGISDIKPVSAHFRRVQLHSNNRFYSFLLRVCELIHNNLLVSEDTGAAQFRDFVRDQDRMSTLFEKFVRNFYRHEQATYRVKSEHLRWRFNALNDESARLLPLMRTDISLDSPKKKIIIDTKYYERALTHHFGKESLQSTHLYQISAYLAHSERDGRELEGILLYPTVNHSLNTAYFSEGSVVRVRTINLVQKWTAIRDDLLAMVA